LAHLGGITEIEVRALAIVVMITSLAAVPAFAQGGSAKTEANKADERKKKEAEEIEKTYQDTLKKTTREQPAKKTDPWGSVR
jgi:Tfp pilus assembly protein PilE